MCMIVIKIHDDDDVENNDGVKYIELHLRINISSANLHESRTFCANAYNAFSNKLKLRLTQHPQQQKYQAEPWCGGDHFKNMVAVISSVRYETKSDNDWARGAAEQSYRGHRLPLASNSIAWESKSPHSLENLRPPWSTEALKHDIILLKSTAKKVADIKAGAENSNLAVMAPYIKLKNSLLSATATIITNTKFEIMKLN
uniref:Uncharacterized protein n=1 Tax=Glossina pallidipes TaxID=7398 RepID=A0A1B0AJ77_GLOPL